MSIYTASAHTTELMIYMCQNISGVAIPLPPKYPILLYRYIVDRLVLRRLIIANALENFNNQINVPWHLGSLLLT